MARHSRVGWLGVSLVVFACQDTTTPGTSTGGMTSGPSTGDVSSSSSGADESGTMPPVLPDLGDGPGPSQTADCANYVACAQALMLEDAEDIEQMYGSGAACWDTSETMAQCDDECEEALAAIVMQLEMEGQSVPDACDPPQAVSWAQVRTIIDDNCVEGCHEPGGTDESLDLSEQAYYAIYQVSSDQSLLFLVEPGSHEDSYFWHKINGSQGSVGGMGSRMPRGAEPLSQEDIDAVADWIDSGAPG